jgi:hypothetical protein
MPSLTRLLAIVLVVAGLLAGIVHAVEPTPESTTIRVHGKDFSSAVKLGDEVLEYRGGGLLKWFMWDVYTAAFYLPEDVPSRPSEFLGKQPAYLVIEYQRDIKASDFVKATKKGLEKNPRTPWKELEPQLQELYKMYEDIKPGDRYCIAVTPEGNTEIRLNGELRGTFEGRAFAEAFLGIWVSEHSLKPSFSDQLLGLR